MMNNMRQTAGSDLVYKQIVFKDFTGITLADKNIIEHLPLRYDTLSPALENVYLISPAAGKGSGMFAARDIPLAGVILVENPVIIYPNLLLSLNETSGDEPYRLLFDGLHPDLRSKALSLHNSKPPHVCAQAEGIVRTNAFGICLPSGSADLDNITHSGVFLDLSRCNHR